MLGGFTTNFLCVTFCLYATILPVSISAFLRTRTMIAPSTLRLQLSTIVANYAWAALAGIAWYFQFFFYSMGETKMGKYHSQVGRCTWQAS